MAVCGTARAFTRHFIGAQKKITVSKVREQLDRTHYCALTTVQIVPLAIELVVILASPAAGIGNLLPQQNDKRLPCVSSN